MLELLIPAGAFLFGAMIGSFLNVVIYRLPRSDEGLSVSTPRLSVCPRCKTTIRGYDNVPLVSYFVLAGKCRSCKAPIPFRYFFVELLTATLFAVVALRFEGDWPLAAVYALLTAALIAVTFIDVDFRIIPDKIDLPGMALAPAVSALVPALHGYGPLSGSQGDLAPLGLALENQRLMAALSSGFGILVGAGIIYAIGLLGSLVFRKEAMGFGDVKLLGMIGGFLGWKGVLLVLLLACLAGSVVGIIVKLVTRDSYIPFGPFLSVGALGVILGRSEIIELIFVRYPKLVSGLIGPVGILMIR